MSKRELTEFWHWQKIENMIKKRNAKETKRQCKAGAGRASIPPSVIEEVLRRCRRRCCMCFGLKDDWAVKAGQIAHLDRNRANPKSENLVFLCQDCHTLYDTKSNSVQGFTPGEVRSYRDEMYAALGLDNMEWSLIVRADRSQYDTIKRAVDRAYSMLLALTQDVTLMERSHP